MESQQDTARFSKASLDGKTVEQLLQGLLEIKDSVKVLICDEILHDDDIGTLDQLLRKYYTELHLTSIQLPNNSLTAAAAPALCRILDSAQTLKELDLRHNRLGAAGLKILVESLVFQKSTSLGASLTMLNLIDNELKGGDAVACIARILRSNQTIEMLYLGHNRLGCHGMKDFAHSLAVNESLRTLSLRGNHVKANGISALVKEGLIRNCCLRCLDLECNQVGVKGAQTLETYLSYDKVLEELNLSSNSLGVDGAKAFTSVLTFNYTLRELRLSGNQIGNEGAEAISVGLVKNSSLQILHLDWNSLEDAAASSLSVALKANSSLVTLNLANNRIACEGIQELTESLTFNFKLEELDVQGNRMRDEGAFVLAKAIGHSKSSLKRLVWNDNPLSEQGAAALDHAFTFRKNIKWMNSHLTLISSSRGPLQWDFLERNIGDEEVILLTSSLNTATKPRIRTLSLTGTNITGRSIQSLCSWLSDSAACLDRLFLLETRAGDDGAKALGCALETNKNLQLLSVIQSGITAEGARALAHGLSRNARLKRLTLNRNAIGDEGLLELAQVIQPPQRRTGQHESSKSVLCALSVEGNGITDESMAAVSKTILAELYLQKNEITDEGALDLAKGFLTDCKLEWLGVSGNTGITKKGRGALRACLPDKCHLDL